MNRATNLKGEALILASGPTNPDADALIKEALQPFVHEILDMQRIDLAGRTIVAILIALDPAHEQAITAELESAGLRANLDIAVELQ